MCYKHCYLRYSRQCILANLFLLMSDNDLISYFSLYVDVVIVTCHGRYLALWWTWHNL